MEILGRSNQVHSVPILQCPIVWLFSMLYLLSNTHGWYSEFWLPFIPLLIILLVGAKLQVIITKMGMRILERGDIIKGTPVVEPNDDLFWFKNPRFLLFLIHLVLFTNAFQLAFFSWSWYEFGYPSCYHQNLEDMLIRVIMGVTVQVLCSYVTLPLYALVTQMGTSMKPVIFSKEVASALRGWHHIAQKHLKQGHKSGSNTPFSSRPGTPLHGSVSPLHLLRGYQNSVENGRQESPRRLTEGWANERRSISPHQHDYENSVENGRQVSPRRSNNGWANERVLPHHHEIEIGNHEIEMMDDSNINIVVFDQGEIEMDLENPSSIRHHGQISQSDFSFGDKNNSG